MEELPSDTLGNISRKAIEKLKELGWKESNIYDVDAIKEEIKCCGFTMNPIAEQILKDFGGYEFSFSGNNVSAMEFTFHEGGRTFPAKHLGLLEGIIDDSAPCPVASRVGHILFACPSGRIALLQDQWYYLAVFETFADVLDALLFNDYRKAKEFPEIESYTPDW